MREPRHGEWRLERGAAVGPQLVRILRDRIVRADIAPGARISESEIGEEYGLSRQPVREAFIKLSHEGLLEVRPQRGTVVRLISASAVRDARFVREAVEAAIARRAAAAERRGMIVGALRAQIAMQAAAPAERPEIFLALDRRFHRMLAEASGAPGAWRAAAAAKVHTDRVRLLSPAPFPQRRLVSQHAAIVHAIEAGDPDAAEAAMRGHLNEILAVLPAVGSARAAFFAREG